MFSGVIAGRFAFPLAREGDRARACLVRQLAHAAGHRAEVLRRRQGERDDAGHKSNRQRRSDEYSCDERESKISCA
jgi:hypothetical protein